MDLYETPAAYAISITGTPLRDRVRDISVSSRLAIAIRESGGVLALYLEAKGARVASWIPMSFGTEGETDRTEVPGTEGRGVRGIGGMGLSCSLGVALETQK